MDHVFGPVNSRRLGRSLGIDLFVDKICNLNCIYCEVGPTENLTCSRDSYVPTSQIIAELKQVCLDSQLLDNIDVFTVTASGEPTLHEGLGEILAYLKENSTKKVVVLTNGTTLSDPDVRSALRFADIVVPSLDAVMPKSFRKLNRPAECLTLKEIIDGLIEFSHEYSGQLWLEILFALGVNDSEQDLQALSEVVSQMVVTRIQLNTVARPPLEKYAKPVSRETLEEFAAILSQKLPSVPVDILAGSTGEVEKTTTDLKDQVSVVTGVDDDALEKIVNMLKRRPCTAADINRTFLLGGPDKVEQYLEPLVRSGRLELRLHGKKYYYH